MYLGFQPTLTVETDRIDRVLKKVVKGIFYKLAGRPVRDTTEILLFSSEVLQQDGYDLLLPDDRPWTGFGDDVFLCKYVTDITYPDAMWCLMQFYGRYLIAGQTVPEELAHTPDTPNKPR